MDQGDPSQAQRSGQRGNPMSVTNHEIATNLNLWNEYFNVDAMMTDEEFEAMEYQERIAMLVKAFGADGSEEI